MKFILPILLIISFFCYSSNAYQCYTCSEHTGYKKEKEDFNQNCRTLPPGASTEDCDDECTFFYNKKIDRVVRGCDIKELGKEPNWVKKQSCKSDKCNNAPLDNSGFTVQFSSIILIIPSLLLFTLSSW
ncbi:hypothetical protein SNEBB_000039 [Seison nebaliae]|nr:hypothetical protein SNEBB_000039 [Seison nebaliae]